MKHPAHTASVLPIGPQPGGDDDNNDGDDVDDVDNVEDDDVDDVDDVDSVDDVDNDDVDDVDNVDDGCDSFLTILMKLTNAGSLPGASAFLILQYLKRV